MDFFDTDLDWKLDCLFLSGEEWDSTYNKAKDLIRLVGDILDSGCTIESIMHFFELDELFNMKYQVLYEYGHLQYLLDSSDKRSLSLIQKAENLLNEYTLSLSQFESFLTSLPESDVEEMFNDERIAKYKLFTLY